MFSGKERRNGFRLVLLAPPNFLRFLRTCFSEVQVDLRHHCRVENHPAALSHLLLLSAAGSAGPLWELSCRKLVSPRGQHGAVEKGPPSTASTHLPRAAGVSEWNASVSVPWGSAVLRLHVTAVVEAACPALRLWHPALFLASFKWALCVCVCAWC